MVEIRMFFGGVVVQTLALQARRSLHVRRGLWVRFSFGRQGLIPGNAWRWSARFCGVDERCAVLAVLTGLGGGPTCRLAGYIGGIWGRGVSCRRCVLAPFIGAAGRRIASARPPWPRPISRREPCRSPPPTAGPVRVRRVPSPSRANASDGPYPIPPPPAGEGP